MQERELLWRNNLNPTDMSRSTTTTSKVMPTLAHSLEKDLHPGAGSLPMVASSLPSDKQMVLPLLK